MPDMTIQSPLPSESSPISMSADPASESLEAKRRIANIIDIIDPFTASSQATRNTIKSPGQASTFSPAKRFKRQRAEKQNKRRLSHSFLRYEPVWTTENQSKPLLSIFASDGSIHSHIVEKHMKFPAYSPFNRDALLARLSSFSSHRSNWRYEPAESATSPLTWARAGWKCCENEEYTVQCELCKAKFCLDLVAIRSEKTRPAAEITRARRGHKDTCLWRRRVCDGMDKFMTRPLTIITDDIYTQKNYMPYRLYST